MPGARIMGGERVTLRTVEEEDVPFLQRGLANPELRYPMGNPVRNQAQIGLAGERGNDQLLVCLDEDGGKPIGQVSVTDAAYKRPEIGYWLIPPIHGESYGTESVSLLVDYAFRTYNTPAVGTQAFDSNDASHRLLESLGFTQEGRRRKFMFVDDKHRDMVQYGLLRDEWN